MTYYKPPFNPPFSVFDLPKWMFWPILAGSYLFWAGFVFLHVLLRTIGEAGEAFVDHYNQSCCIFKFLLSLPLILPVLVVCICVAYILGVVEEERKLWKDLKKAVEWYKQKRA